VLDYYTSEPDHAVIGATLDACARTAGLRIERESVSGDSLISRVLQQGSSRTLPDILMLDNPDLKQIAKTTALLPLHVPTTGYAPAVLAAGSYNGQVYGLVPTANTIALFYNKRMLASAGIQPPRTWAELQAASVALTKPGRYGIAFSAAASYEGAWQFLPFLWSNGADERDISSPQAVQALQFVVNLVTSGGASPSVLNWGQADAKDQFVAGRAAMMVNGPWQIPDLRKHPDIDYGVVPVPVPKLGQHSVAPLGGELWTVPNTGNVTKERQAAAVLTCCTSDATQVSMGAQRYTVPAKPSLAQEYLKRRPDMAAFVELVAGARSRTAELGDRWPQTATALYTAVQLAVSGQATSTQALTEMQEK
jgi:multiple sugar transport system substrate-binding protein